MDGISVLRRTLGKSIGEEAEGDAPDEAAFLIVLLQARVVMNGVFDQPKGFWFPFRRPAQFAMVHTFQFIGCPSELIRMRAPLCEFGQPCETGLFGLTRDSVFAANFGQIPLRNVSGVKIQTMLR